MKAVVPGLLTWATGLLFLICFLTFFPSPVAAREKKVVMVIIDHLSYYDWLDAGGETLHRLMDQGSLGLLNVNIPGMKNEETILQTMGAGGALPSGDSGKYLDAGESYLGYPAGEIYRRLTGRVTGDSRVVDLALARVEANYPPVWSGARPGVLGEALHLAGKKTAVIGNRDLVGELKRPATAVAVDGNGLVDLGEVGGALVAPTERSPLLETTSYAYLRREVEWALSESDFMVIDLGDSARLEAGREDLSQGIYRSEKIRIMKQVDEFLGWLLERLDLNDSRLVVLSPTPSKESIAAKKLLAPIVMVGGGLPQGLLTSGSTRREGLLTIYDLAPGVMHYLGVPAPGGLTGRLPEVLPRRDSVNWLKGFYDKSLEISRLRPPLVQGYVLAQIILIAMALVAVLHRPSWARVLQPFLLAVGALPLALLLAAGIPVPITALVPLILGITAALVVVVSWFTRPAGNPWAVLAGATSLILAADVLTGANLIKLSPLGYDPIAGARYYGIGNEFMGILVGSTVLAVAMLWTSLEKGWSRFLAISYMAAVALVVGLPGLGSNLGGAIPAAIAFGFIVLKITRSSLSWKMLFGVAAGIVIWVFALLVYDLGRDTQIQTHLGRFAFLVFSGDWQQVTQVFIRKWQLNIKLVLYTVWSRVLLVGLAAQLTLLYRPVGLAGTLKMRYPVYFVGFQGVILAAVTALLVNDSGIVAASTTLIFGVLPFISLVLEEVKGQGKVGYRN